MAMNGVAGVGGVGAVVDLRGGEYLCIVTICCLRKVEPLREKQSFIVSHIAGIQPK